LVLALPSMASAADLHATPSTFAAMFAVARDGDRILLASGNYGTWTGGNKSVTIRAEDGASPTMKIDFTTGDAGFTLDGLGGMGGSITDGANHITIRNATFSSHLIIDGVANASILLDHNRHVGIDSPTGDPNARIALPYSSSQPSGVTIENSYLAGGDADGVHTGTAVNVIDNEFADICDRGGNHTDNIQFEGATGGRIAGNYIHATCTTQGITSYDGGTNGVVVEDNVVDIHRSWGIEFYADRNSIIRHNTVRYYGPGCYADQTCGLIDINRKSTDAAGSGTQVYDNVAEVTVANGSTTARNDHNLSGAQVTYVGPTTTYAGFALAPGSAGKGAASDGLDIGIRAESAPPAGPADGDGDGVPDGQDACPDTPGTGADGCPPHVPPPPGDHTPVAAFTYSPIDLLTGRAVVFDASASTCEDAPCTYTWADDGPDGPGGTQWPLGTGPSLTFTFRVVGTKNVRVTVTDADGDTDTTVKSVSVASSAAPPPIDTLAPETTITAGPDTTTDDATPTFAFTSSDAVATFDCRLDSGPWASCASPWTTAALSDGDHTVWVRAVDPAGGADASPATWSFTVAAAQAGSELLLGDATVQLVADSIAAGSAEAFQATASGSGRAARISVYVDSGNGASATEAGIYSDAGGHPGTLLTKGTLSGLQARAWNDVAVLDAPLVSGQRYWLAVLALGGRLGVRDSVGIGCHSEVSSSTTLATLPQTWRAGALWASCNLSGYAAT
jgi:hypothetical protein